MPTQHMVAKFLVASRSSSSRLYNSEKGCQRPKKGCLRVGYVNSGRPGSCCWELLTSNVMTTFSSTMVTMSRKLSECVLVSLDEELPHNVRPLAVGHKLPQCEHGSEAAPYPVSENAS